MLRQRWSPRAFDDAHQVSAAQVEVLLEAARWAPSAGNSQPWAFRPARRDDPGWVELAACLTGGSRPWATQASLLVVNLAQLRVEDTDWEYSEFALYDLGQAVAHLSIQAHSMGLACRQFRAFDRAGVERLLGVPAHWQAVTMTALGRPAPRAERDPGSATRAPQIRWPRC